MDDLTHIKGIRNSIVGTGTKAASQFAAHPLNFRKHPQRQRAAVEASLRSLGFIAPVIENVRTGNLIDGHERVWQALQADDADVPFVQVDLSPEDEALALATFDAITNMAQTDAAMLDQLLQEVSTGEAALMELIAETAAEAGLFLDKPDEADAEPQMSRADELQQEWGTATGQLWRLPSRTPGQEHRLICGDCTDAEVVARVTDIPLNLMVTDPPYGVEYDANWRNEAAAEGKLAYAASRIGKVDNDDRAEWSDAWRLFPGDVAYTWSPPGDHVIITGQALQAAGYEIRSMLLWRKPHFPISRGHYTYVHEPCWYAVKKGQTASWIGPANERTVWDITLDKNVDGGHSTQKPLECMARPIRNHEGDVYEPFCGSGTTIIAAENLGRQCRAVEIAPGYVAVALQRYRDAFGIEPELVE